MRSRVGGAKTAGVGGATTCSDCQSQTGQCVGTEPLRSAESEVWRESLFDVAESETIPHKTCEWFSAPNVLKNT